MTTKSSIVFPIHCNENHWIMIKADFTSRELTNYDGLDGRKAHLYCKLVACCLEMHYSQVSQQRKAEKFLRWKTSKAQNFPRQDNGDNCGVFLIHGAACLAFNSSNFNWNRSDINHLRKFYGGYLVAQKGQNIPFLSMFANQESSPKNVITAPSTLNVKVCTPEERNPKASVFHKLLLNCNENLSKEFAGN